MLETIKGFKPNKKTYTVAAVIAGAGVFFMGLDVNLIADKGNELAVAFGGIMALLRSISPKA